jgi:hypothetical protein
MKPGEVINVGDNVTYHNNPLICTDLDPDNEIYEVGILARCNNILKWLDDTNTLVSRYCICLNKSLYTTGESETKYMIIPDSKLQITIPLDDDTIKIKRGMRFLIGIKGIYYAYKATLPDIVSSSDINNGTGLVSLVLEEDAINTEMDNLVEGIAYNGKKSIQPDGNNLW